MASSLCLVSGSSASLLLAISASGFKQMLQIAPSSPSRPAGLGPPPSRSTGRPVGWHARRLKPEKLGSGISLSACCYPHAPGAGLFAAALRPRPLLRAAGPG